MKNSLNEELAQNILDLVGQGLTSGLGVQKPGRMCVEAAVCAAMGLPHSDEPPCVGNAVRAFKISLNDARWSSNESRGQGMLALSIAQLGSDEIDQDEFTKIVAKETIKQILPIALRNAAKRNNLHAEALEEAAQSCEKEGTRASARKARDVAFAASAADAADAAADAAYAAASAAGYAADALCCSCCCCCSAAARAAARADAADADAILF